MRRLVLMLVLPALIGAACSASDRAVATVNGVDIQQSLVTELRDTGTATISAEDFRSDLMILIAQEVVNQAAATEYGVEVDAALVAAELQRLLTGLESSGQTPGDLLRIPGATEVMLRRNVEASLLRQSVIDELHGDRTRLEAIWNDQPGLFTNVCTRHLLMATEEAAAAARDRVLAGEEFGAVADEVSLDSPPGGDLGCSPSSRYVDSFAAASAEAPLNEPFGPVESEFGWHVLYVYDRNQVTLDDLVADPGQYLPAELMTQEFVAWFNEKLREADVRLDPSIGEWFPEGPGILPPDQATDEP